MNAAEQSLAEARALSEAARTGVSIGKRLNVGPIYPPASAPVKVNFAEPEEELAALKSAAAAAVVHGKHTRARRKQPTDAQLAAMALRLGEITSKELMSECGIDNNHACYLLRRAWINGALIRVGKGGQLNPHRYRPTAKTRKVARNVRKAA